MKNNNIFYFRQLKSIHKYSIFDSLSSRFIEDKVKVVDFKGDTNISEAYVDEGQSVTEKSIINIAIKKDKGFYFIIFKPNKYYNHSQYFSVYNNSLYNPEENIIDEYSFEKNKRRLYVLAKPNCFKYALLKEYPHFIQYIKSPDEDMQIDVVMNDPSSIRHIKKQSEFASMWAVILDISTFKYIKNPSKDVIEQYDYIIKKDRYVVNNKRNMVRIKDLTTDKNGYLQYKD